MPVQTTNAAELTSVVVVAADSGEDLAECARCVLASTVPVELIVSDNASRDGSVEALAARAVDEPRLRIVRNGRNLGFGAGCNRGAAQARGDALLFLNPDCRIAPDTIARLRAHLFADARVGLLGAAIVGIDGALEPASRRREPTLRRALCTLTGLARWESRFPALAGVNRRDPPQRPIELVDAVSGALLLLPRAVFEQIGGFDEGYFLHAEDLDLCRRVRDAGWQVACANEVRVMHRKGTSSRRRPLRVAAHKRRGMWRWFVKFDPAARQPGLRALVACGLWAHFFLLAPWRAIQGWRARRQR